jgi:type I restriction enzyme M protein
MVLHGDGNINIFGKDGLLPFSYYEIPNKISILKSSKIKTNYQYSYEVNESFDTVMSNPPFSVSLDTETKRTLPNRFMYYDKHNSENLFIERWYQLLKEGGRLGVVLPESVFDTGENIYIRLFIYKYFEVKAIISLPSLTFQPFTQTKTSLLFAKKKTREQVEVYEAKWREFANEYQRLKRKVTKYANGIVEDQAEANADLRRYLKNYFEEKDSGLAVNEIVAKYQDEIKEIDGGEDWWIFGEVSKHLNYDILFAEAEEIGYKRSKRGEQKRPNELFQEDANRNIIINTSQPKTILDLIKLKVRWN